MSLKPRITVEDNYVDGLSCAICESSDLIVVHVKDYPDFVQCGNCQSAFVVEDEGSWIMYGKINAELPETKEFALRQWTWLDAVRQRAADEKEPEEPSPPSSPEVELEATPVEGEFVKSEVEISPTDEVEQVGEVTLEIPGGETSSPVDLSERIDSIIPGDIPPSVPEDSKEEGPTFEAIVQEAEEFTLPEDIPLHLDQAETEAPVEDISPIEVDPIQLDRLEQVSAPAEEIPTEAPADILESEGSVEELPIDDLMPESEGLPSPDWLESGPTPEAEEIAPPTPIAERDGDDTETLEEHKVPPFLEDDPTMPAEMDIESAVSAEPEPATSTKPAQFLDLLKADTPPLPSFIGDLPDSEAPAVEEEESTVPDAVDDVAGLEEVDEPIDEHLLPPWAREDDVQESPPAAETIAEPIQPAAVPEMEERAEPEPALFTPAEAVGMGTLPTELEVAPPVIQETEQPPGEPEHGFRHRVQVKGDTLTFPKNVCSHCLQMPVSLAAAVRGTLPDPAQSNIRKPRVFKLPLCKNCENRAKASTDEERAARTQAYLISGAVSVVLMLLVLLLRIAPFDSSVLEGLMVLLIIGILAFVGPLLFLLNRASKYPPPYDAAYVLTTLRVADDAGEGLTAFEWRNEGYAELFRQVNRRMADENIVKVEDVVLLTEPVLEEMPTGSEEGISDRDFEEMISDAQPTDEDIAEGFLEPDSSKVDSLEQAFLEKEPPEQGSENQV